MRRQSHMALHHSGMLLNQGYLLPDLINPDPYGIDIDASASDIATNNDVQVPNIQFHISEDVVNTAMDLILVGIMESIIIQMYVIHWNHMLFKFEHLNTKYN